MTKEDAMSDPMERIIRETLAGYPRPELSSGFAAKVAGRIDRRERRRELVRGAGVVLGVYWTALPVVSGFLLAGVEWPSWSPLALAAMTPFVFLAAAAPRHLVRRASRALNLSAR